MRFSCIRNYHSYVIIAILLSCYFVSYLKYLLAVSSMPFQHRQISPKHVFNVDGGTLLLLSFSFSFRPTHSHLVLAAQLIATLSVVLHISGLLGDVFLLLYLLRLHFGQFFIIFIFIFFRFDHFRFIIYRYKRFEKKKTISENSKLFSCLELE